MSVARITTVALAAFSAWMSPIGAAAAESPSGADSVVVDDSLAATAAAPWNPPAPLSSAEPWEQAVRFPLQVASVPFSLLGRVTHDLLLRFDEYHVSARIESLAVAQRRIGLFATPASLGDRTGFGVAVRYQPPRVRVLTLEANGSLERYSRVRAALARGPAALSYRSEWRPQDQFFGIGPGAGEEAESNYASRTQQVELALGRTIAAPALPWPWTLGRVPQFTARTWIGPRAVVLSDGRDERVERLGVTDPALAAVQFAGRLEHLVYGARVGLDARSGAPHWTQGARIALEAERYDRSVEALALRDAHTPARSFTRLSAEVETGVSWWRDPRTLRLAVRATAVRPDAGAGTLPILDLAQLGGSAGLAGYEPGRFHDTHSLFAKLSYLFPLARFFELDLHAEAGGVYPDLDRAPRLDGLPHSFGVALRPRTKFAVIGKIGVDVSTEATRFGFSLGSPE